VCRTPWCDAIVRHADHLTRVADGGATSAANGNGRCEACNYAKDSPGWAAAAPGTGGAGHVAETVTPTGHRYATRPPPLPGTRAAGAVAGREPDDARAGPHPAAVA
jgi:hypothetical protein